jgi:hypothetical protein
LNSKVPSGETPCRTLAKGRLTLEYRADQQETTVSGVLARELDGIASAHIEELSAVLPGFAEAMAWPVG